MFNSSDDRVSNIRGTSLEMGGVAIYFCRIVFFFGGGGGEGGAAKNVEESPPTTANSLPQN